MKKTIYLLATLFVIAAIASCSKEATGDSEFDLLKKATVITIPTASQPVSLGEGVTPYLIPGSNNGGNRTCAEVATAWKLDPNPFLCGEKIDYNNGAFTGVFPSGLNVAVTAGKYVSFNMEDCILIGDKYYKVGAVIVKGSNAANVYYYPEGSISDSNLASPINASGAPAGLSNLTFCFFECDDEPLVIAVKAWYWNGPVIGSSYLWAASDGNVVTEFTGEWCTDFMGYTGLPLLSSVNMLEGYSISLGLVNPEIGSFSINSSGILTLALDNEAYIIDNVHVFVGTYDELVSTIGYSVYRGPGCPLYDTSDLWQHFDAPNNSHTFSTPSPVIP